MTAEDFIKSTGFAPENDDLERANCPLAGTIGHIWCGICRHGEVRFACVRCAGRLPRKVFESDHTGQGDVA